MATHPGPACVPTAKRLKPRGRGEIGFMNFYQIRELSIHLDIIRMSDKSR
jgi:hypothetical protein